MRQGVVTTAARRLLERRASEVLKRRQDVCRRARPDDIHDLRVATRRLQEAIDLLAFALPERERTRARRRARRIRRGFAEVRDADVLLETLIAVAGRCAPADRRALLALRPGLQARARRARIAASKRAGAAERARADSPAGARPGSAARDRIGAPPGGGVAGLPVPGLRRRLRVLLRALPPVPAPALARVAARLLAARSAAVGRGLERARSGRAADLHRLRIAVKKYRYTLELMNELGLGRYARAIGAARRIQEQLGRLHDVDVLLALLRRGRGAGPAIPAALRRERRALVAGALTMAARFRPVAGSVLP